MIADPRQYSTVYPDSNIILNQAKLVLENKITLTELEQVIANALRDNNDALINVALNLSPSFVISELIWNSLENAINNNSTTCVFAIPLVLVLGSDKKTKINSVINTEKLNDFLQSKDIFVSGTETFVSGKLIDPLTISTIKPSQLYYWVRNLNNAKLWLPVEMPASNIEIKGEAVFLRFLIGVTTKSNNASILSIKDFINHDTFRSYSMEFMQLINNELKNDKVTLFPIPFSPVTLSSSYAVGNEKRVEIAISVAMSNIVRKIREAGLIPLAIISTDTDAIKVTIECVGNDKLKEISLWHLKRFEDFNHVHVIITELLHDMQIEWSYA